MITQIMIITKGRIIVENITAVERKMIIDEGTIRTVQMRMIIVSRNNDKRRKGNIRSKAGSFILGRGLRTWLPQAGSRTCLRGNLSSGRSSGHGKSRTGPTPGSASALERCLFAPAFRNFLFQTFRFFQKALGNLSSRLALRDQNGSWATPCKPNGSELRR